MQSITTDSGEALPLPTEVREQDPTKTSVYCAGELVYDGATGEGIGKPGSSGPGQSLNEMLKWSIEHSDSAELARRAAEGAAPPSQLDKEILDMLLGQPTVAKVRLREHETTRCARCHDDARPADSPARCRFS